MNGPDPTGLRAGGRAPAIPGSPILPRSPISLGSANTRASTPPLRRATRALAYLILSAIVLITLTAPFTAPYDPAAQFREHLLAPPMPLRVRDADGHWQRPFFYPLRSISRLERTFAEDRSRPVPLTLFKDGHLLRPATLAHGPWLPLGSDRLGRDIASRLVYGARVSLGVAVVAVAGALLLGLLIGTWAGMVRGLLDAALMRLTEFVLILPALYVVLAARATLPASLSPLAVFLLLAGVLAVIGWPTVAASVRAIVRVEMTKDYVAAARASGAGALHLLRQHLWPAAAGVLRVQALLLLPAAIMAETTLSFVGLGFDADRPSWGTLLQDASDIRALTDYPWLLSAGGAIVLLVWALNLLLEPRDRGQGSQA